MRSPLALQNLCSVLLRLVVLILQIRCLRGKKTMYSTHVVLRLVVLKALKAPVSKFVKYYY